MAVGILVIFSAQLVLELVISGYPLNRLSAISPNEAREFLNLLNSKLIQAMGVVLIAVGLAVPLTANMYSLKFLDFFIRNPVNAAVLIFVVFANLSGLWASYCLKSTVIPIFQLHLVFILTITSLVRARSSSRLCGLDSTDAVPCLARNWVGVPSSPGATRLTSWYRSDSLFSTGVAVSISR